MIIPYIYGRLELSLPGNSLKNTIARENIRTGPTIQFWINDSPKILKLRKTPPNSSYFTFASGGYIISIKPIAIGILVVLSGLDFNEFQNDAIEGKKYPEKTPINIARNIHNVRYRSKNLSFAFILTTV
jgi:hypothetical protein